MPGKQRPISLIAMVAAMALCGASAFGADDVQPTNDLPNPFPDTVAPWGGWPFVNRMACGQPLAAAPST